MAGPFQPGGFFGPPAAGQWQNPAMNFATMLAGFAQGNPLAGFQTLGRQQKMANAAIINRQLMNMRLAQMRREEERRRKTVEAATTMVNPLVAGVAPAVLQERTEALMQVAQGAPELILSAGLSRMGIGAPAETFRPLTMAEVESQGLNPQMSYQVSSKTGRIYPIGAPQTVISLGGERGSVPAGMVRTEAPESPTGTALVPEPGGPEDVKRRTGMITLEGMYNDIQELRSLVQTYGTEAYGPQARRMGALRNRIIGNIPAVRETGVLQEGELRRLEKEIPRGDQLFRPGKMVLPALQGFEEEVGRVLEEKRRIFTAPGTEGGTEGGTGAAAPAETPQAPAEAAQAITGPAPGTIDEGYIFLGGDPGDEDNWVKQR